MFSAVSICPMTEALWLALRGRAEMMGVKFPSIAERIALPFVTVSVTLTEREPSVLNVTTSAGAPGPAEALGCEATPAGSRRSVATKSRIAPPRLERLRSGVMREKRGPPWHSRDALDQLLVLGQIVGDVDVRDRGSEAVRQELQFERIGRPGPARPRPDPSGGG